MEYRILITPADQGEGVHDFIERWVEQPALRRVFEAAGATWPRGSLAERVSALHQFSDRWDRRAGGERVDIREPEDAGMHPSIVLASAATLGMAASAPPSQARYDHGLALGGTALASALRVKHLYELRHGGIAFGTLGMLTALREVSSGEKALLTAHPPLMSLQHADTEFDVMVAAAELFGGGTAHVEKQIQSNPNDSSAIARVDHAEVLAAPSADPSRRANTFDNYTVYRNRINPGDSLLVVTSAIYLPYQFLVAIQALGWARPLQLEAVGFPPEWLGGVLTQPANYLQELRSALFAARATLAKLEAS